LLLCRVSAQKSDESFSSQQRSGSFSSQQRPRETSEITQEPAAEQERPEPQTFKEKVMDKLQGLSIMPKPEQALESLREESSASPPESWTSFVGGEGTSDI